MTVSKEILNKRKAGLTLLQGKYKDKLNDLIDENAKIAVCARIDEINLQIESIDKLLKTSLVSFSPKRIHPPETKKKKKKSYKKAEDEIIVSPIQSKKHMARKLVKMPLEKDEELFKI